MKITAFVNDLKEFYEKKSGKVEILKKKSIIMQPKAPAKKEVYVEKKNWADEGRF